MFNRCQLLNFKAIKAMESGDHHKVATAASSSEGAGIILLSDIRQIHLMRKMILRLLFLPTPRWERSFYFTHPWGSPFYGPEQSQLSPGLARIKKGFLSVKCTDYSIASMEQSDNLRVNIVTLHHLRHTMPQSQGQHSRLSSVKKGTR